MASPTETYCEWFETLTPAVAEELAVALMQLFPGEMLKSTLLTSSPLDGFTPRLRRLASAAPVADAGVALTVAALTDFVFLERSSPERWQKNREMLEVLDEAQREHLKADEDLSAELTEWIEDNKLRHPLRSRQWLKEYDRWQALRRGALDPEAINRALFGSVTGVE